MTTSSSPHSADAIDTGPLSWVMGEIREALGRSKTSLREALTPDAEAQATALHHAKAYLHQAHGALQIVDIDGIALITETVEDMFERIEAQQLGMSDQVADAIDNAYQALVEYLQELLSGAKHQPVRLFPYYRALLEARGAERIHPADLFFPNLSVRVQVPATTAAPDYVALRKRFERALLPFLKNAGEPSHAVAMRDIIGEVEAAQNNPHARTFWWVMHGFADAVSSGSVPNEIYIKQLFARVNLQLRRLSEGSASIAERLQRDALFFIARADSGSPRVKQIQAAYQIGGVVPSDYEKKRYGQIDVNVLIAAKERLSQAKNVWNRIAGGDASAGDLFVQEMSGLAEVCANLESPALSKLLRELNGIARHAAHPGDAVGLEIATSLLFVESALNNIAQLPDDFAARADAMTARLLAIVSGEKPVTVTAGDWLDDMSKEAQQRQTMTVLATEMQSSLRQVEKTLDEYFNEPSQKAGLEQIGSVLHQIEGALVVLDQDDAMRAVRHVNATVKRFAESEETPDREEFQHVARNVGALSFFIETLQLNPDGARKRFAFDDQEGVFHAKLIEKKSEAPALEIEVDLGAGPAAAANAPAAADSPSPADEMPTVEDELAFHQQHSAELAVSLSIEPDNAALQEQLKASLEQVRIGASLVDNPEAGDRARAAIDLLKHADFGNKHDALTEIITATVPAHVPVPAPAAPAPAMPSSDEAVDAELLEIFLLEAEEVLACVRDTLPRSRTEPYNQDHLTTLRRSFHTLKGSSRMVGLNTFGEAAWSIEQILNLRLSETKPGDPDLYALIEKAADVLGDWVAELQASGRSDRSAAPLCAAAERMKAGGAFTWEELPPAVAVAPALESAAVTEVPELPAVLEAVPEPVVTQETELLLDLDLPELSDTEIPPTLPEATETTLSDADFALLQSSVGGADTHPEDEPVIELDSLLHDAEAPAVAPVAEVIAFPSLTPSEPKRDDSIRQIGDISISVPLHNIYLAETDELVRVLSQDIGEWRHEPERHVQTNVVHAAHSLAGSSATVGFTPLQEIAHGLEIVLQFLARRPVRLETADYDAIEHAIDRIRFMLQMFALGEMPEHEPHQVALLAHLLKSLEERANAATAVHEPPAPSAITPHDVVDAPLDESAVDERPVEPGADEAMPPADFVASDAIEEIAALAEVEEEPYLEAEPAVEAVIDAEPIVGIDKVDDAATPEEPAHPPVIEPAVLAPVVDHSGEPFAEPVFAHEGEAAAETALPALKDELDADLLPVFLEEGRDMLPQIGQALRAWQQKPDDRSPLQILLRLLHTVKGSARMAGAMTLGQHLHDMESGLEHLMLLGTPSPQALDDLLARYDAGLQMFELLQNPEAATQAAMEAPEQQDPQAAEAAPQVPEIVPEAVKPGPVELPSLMPSLHGKFATPQPAAVVAAQPNAVTQAVPTPLVRVRADILDRLVNQAGEVSISRSRLETEVGGLRQSLSELHENVNRLRDQLRELEMQAESQITSRMAQSADREFDPLEFDRFTRLQELTRMMAESVNDVGSVQQNLLRTIDGASADLHTQGRLTRELQQDLMRVRMVQFASISERLYRLTRQASKEVNKRVNLDIRGSAVEIDRSVLEKMTGPFEHLLRNAIAHGIEPRERRLAAGKSEIGELLVEIRQEGNEVVIQFSDDGQGLDLAKIRSKAKATGLLTDDGEATDAEVSDLIFHPGFSTASEVTELAGRGIGMDVVRSEAAALGGRVSTWTEAGKGAHFTIHLPLTLAVTQVVLMTTGGKTYAVPSVLVEQVQQLKVHNLTAAYNDGAVIWQGQRVTLHYLSTLLGDTSATPMSQQYSPILILKSGNERVAIHVDEVIGNREVVVKNIGPQLARMIGVAGATVLGSGDIVLILNPVPLAQRLAHEHAVAPHVLPAAQQQLGAVAEVDGSASRGAASEPVQGLRTHRIVMVVDDSLTVRRVTQRLLVREGYQVVLAKDGVDALEHLQSITPDVMLVDIEMPRMDGFDLTRNVRSDERTKHIPIIMITSRTASKHRNYALELGVNEYLGKPYQEDMLVKMIAGFVGKEMPVA